MVASAVIIEPQDDTRESAVELLEKQGFDVTEYAGWKPDFTISDGTTFCLVEAKTLDEHREILDAVRTGDALRAEDAIREHFGHIRTRLTATATHETISPPN